MNLQVDYPLFIGSVFILGDVSSMSLQKIITEGFNIVFVGQ